jgi:hypothetical protein
MQSIPFAYQIVWIQVRSYWDWICNSGYYFLKANLSEDFESIKTGNKAIIISVISYSSLSFVGLKQCSFWYRSDSSGLHMTCQILSHQTRHD